MDADRDLIKRLLEATEDIESRWDAIHESVTWFDGEGFDVDEIAGLTDLPRDVVESVLVKVRRDRGTRMIFYFNYAAAGLLAILIPLYFATLGVLREMAVARVSP